MLTLFLAELKRSWILFRRYPGEAVTMLVTLTLMFLLLFLGIKYVAAPEAHFGERIDALIVGYFVWSLTLVGISGVGWVVQVEAQTGTLEQVFLSPFGAARVCLARLAADALVHLCVLLVVLGAILLITGRSLTFSPSVLPPLLTVLIATWGLGFALGALALVFKRIQGILQLSQYLLVLLVTTPFESWAPHIPWLGILVPLAPGAGLLRDMMVRGAPFDPIGFTIALVNGLGYLLLGLLVFNLAERWVRQRGGLGGY